MLQSTRRSSRPMPSALYTELLTGAIWKRRMACGSTMCDVIVRELTSTIKYKRSGISSRAILGAIRTTLCADRMLTMEAQVDVDVHLEAVSRAQESLDAHDVYATIMR